ncbi:MAG: HD domain-containing protein [Candidatus Paceibacterales bacterium]
MIYKDRIYDQIEISEPLILELIKTTTLQRLKEIDQAGYFEPHYPDTTHSRFEHSLGVFMLLKKFQAPFEEQIAGLIHDVSHSAFSHCIDYVLDSGSEEEHNHQDNIFESFVRESEIPSILEKYGMDVDYILEEDNFPLKERPLPDLCADRLDYSLRTTVIYKEIKKENVDHFLENLIVENNHWIFKNFENAKRYAELFFKLNSLYYAGLPSAVMYRTVGDYLRYALKKSYLTKADLYTTDKQVLEKVKEYLDRDKKLRLLFDRMNNKIKFQNNLEDFDARVFCKSRVVDPLCRDGGEIKRVSEIDKDWVKVLERESMPKKYFIKFER